MGKNIFTSSQAGCFLFIYLVLNSKECTEYKFNIYKF